MTGSLGGDPSGSRAQPPTVTLSLCLMSMTMAGSTYWAPSLASAIARPLNLSPSSAAAFAASVQLGYAFCVFSGLLANRLGPRRTAAVGSLGLSATYLAIAAVVHFKPPFPLAFLVPLAVLISTMSYCVYGATQTAAVMAFPLERRGSINGLLSSVYALSAGILGALQAALFPAVSDAKDGSVGSEGPVVMLLVFVAGLSLIPLVCALTAFPASVSVKRSPPMAASSTRGEYSTVAVSDTDGEQPTSSGASASGAPVLSNDDRGIRTGYVATILLALTLQGCAAVDWVGGVYLGGVRAESILACILVGFLSLFALPGLQSREDMNVPRGSSMDNSGAEYAIQHESRDSAQAGAVEPAELSLQELVVGQRFVYVFSMLAILAGCGGLTLVNTSTDLVASRMIPDDLIASHVAPESIVTGDSIARGVRAVVVLFSALGVAGRLTGGAVMDLPVRSGLPCSGMSMIAWRYTLLQAVASLLCASMAFCAFAKSWWLFINAGAIGYCHGLFFSIAPALTMDIFGVASFARDFAVAGIGAGVGASTLAVLSSLVVRQRRLAGAWVDVVDVAGSASTSRQCVGVACLAPTYLLCAALIMGFVVYSTVARRQLLCPQQ